MSTNPDSTTNKRRKRVRQPKLDERGAIEKLRTMSSLVHRRGYLKDHEQIRASEALGLMAANPTGEIANPTDDIYQLFLFNLKRHCEQENSEPLAEQDNSEPLAKQDDSEPLAILSAIALGKAAIKSAGNDILLLPEKIAGLKAELVNDLLIRSAANMKGPYSGRAAAQERGLQWQNSAPEETAVQAPSENSHDTFAHNRNSVPLDLQLGDLIDFLRVHVGSDKKLRMNFPLSGHPLPSISFASQKPEYVDVKVEFSHPLATTFIRYVMKRG